MKSLIGLELLAREISKKVAKDIDIPYVLVFHDLELDFKIVSLLVEMCCKGT